MIIYTLTLDSFCSEDFLACKPPDGYGKVRVWRGLVGDARKVDLFDLAGLFFATHDVNRTGHVSLETPDVYVSIWPDFLGNTEIESKSGAKSDVCGVSVGGVFLPIEAKAVSSLSYKKDYELEENLPDEVYMVRLDCKKILEKWKTLDKKTHRDPELEFIVGKKWSWSSKSPDNLNCSTMVLDMIKYGNPDIKLSEPNVFSTILTKIRDRMVEETVDVDNFVSSSIQELIRFLNLVEYVEGYESFVSSASSLISSELRGKIDGEVLRVFLEIISEGKIILPQTICEVCRNYLDKCRKEYILTACSTNRLVTKVENVTPFEEFEQKLRKHNISQKTAEDGVKKELDSLIADKLIEQNPLPSVFSQIQIKSIVDGLLNNFFTRSVRAKRDIFFEGEKTPFTFTIDGTVQKDTGRRRLLVITALTVFGGFYYKELKGTANDLFVHINKGVAPFF